MTIIYCAVADKTLKSVKNKGTFNRIRYLDPTNWHIENGGFAISAEISSIHSKIQKPSPEDQNILKKLADRLIETAKIVNQRIAGTEALNPLLDYANIFCLELPDEYFRSLSSSPPKDGLYLLDPSKVNIVGVFRLSIYGKGDRSDRKALEIFLNNSADKNLCKDFQALAQQAATDLKEQLHVEQVDFTIDAEKIESVSIPSDSTGVLPSIRAVQKQMHFQPPPRTPAPADANDTTSLLEPPTDVQMSRSDQSSDQRCPCALT